MGFFFARHSSFWVSYQSMQKINYFVWKSVPNCDIFYIVEDIYVHSAKKKRIRCFRYFNTCTLNPNFSVTLKDIDSECVFLVKLTVHSSMISV